MLHVNIGLLGYFEDESWLLMGFVKMSLMALVLAILSWRKYVVHQP